MKAAILVVLLALSVVAHFDDDNEIAQKSLSSESTEINERHSRNLALDSRTFTLGAYRQSARMPSLSAEVNARSFVLWAFALFEHILFVETTHK